MGKKIVAIYLGITALALFVVPAASASPVLTEKGVAVAVGASFKATNTGSVKMTAAGLEMQCSHAELVGTITSNPGSNFKGEIPVGGAKFTGTGPVSDCTAAVGPLRMTMNSKLCFESVIPTDTVVFTGCGGPITFTLNETGIAQCKYRASGLTATFVTGADFTFNFAEQPVETEEAGFPCPATGKLDMHFDVTTTGGETLLIS
jgi:hypothetical protein